MAKNRAFRFLI